MARPGRRGEVLETAIALFARKGYHATTVRDIADGVGMLSGSLYAHIASKEDLLFQAVVRAADQFMAAVSPIAEGPGPAGEKLRRAMAAHIRVVAQSPEASTVFLHEWKALAGDRLQAAIQRRSAYEALIHRIIDQGVESGEFRPIQEPFVRLLVLSAANWVYQWYRPDGPHGPDEVADRFCDIILHGIKA